MKRRIGLRILVPTLALALLGVAIVLASYLTARGERAFVRSAVTEQVRERLNHLQVSAELFVKLGRLDYLKQLVASLSAEPGLVHMLLVGPDGRIMASNRFSQIGDSWQDAAPDLDTAQIKSVLKSRAVSNINAPDAGAIDGYVSLCGFADEHQLRRSTCGFIAYRVDLAHHYAQTAQVLRNQTGYFAAAIVGVILLLLIALDLLISQRAKRVIQAVQSFVHGERKQRISIGLKDEIGRIGIAVNRMFDEVTRNERDITEQRERLRAIFDTVADAIIIMGDDGVIHTVNPATEQLFGYDQRELIGMKADQLMPPEADGESSSFIQRQAQVADSHSVGNARETTAVDKTGHRFPVEISLSAMQVDDRPMYTSVVRDVSEQVALREAMEQVNAELINSNERLWQSAKTDSLTGIANRRSLDETVDNELRRATRQGRPLSVILIDLDYFKRYNDTYGHIAGDTCLKGVAAVLKTCCQRAGELPARYGGEEFAVVLPDTDRDHATTVAENVRQRIAALDLPHKSSDIADHVTASIGVTAFDPLTMLMPTPTALFEAADRALYSAKQNGRNRVRYAHLHNKDAAERLTLVPMPDKSRR